MWGSILTFEYAVISKLSNCSKHHEVLFYAVHLLKASQWFSSILVKSS